MKKFEATLPAAGGFCGGLLFGVGIGAALMYVLDPDKGQDRRTLIKDKATTWGNDGLAWGGKAYESILGKTQETVEKAERVATKSSIPTSFQNSIQ